MKLYIKIYQILNNSVNYLELMSIKFIIINIHKEMQLIKKEIKHYINNIMQNKSKLYKYYTKTQYI